MKMYLSILFLCLASTPAYCQFVKPMVFERSDIVDKNRPSDVYVLLVGQNERFSEGDALYLHQFQDDRLHYYPLKGRFKFDSKGDISINWQPWPNQKAGTFEKAVLKSIGNERFNWHVVQHSMANQTGTNHPYQVVDFHRLPLWVRSAAETTLVKNMSAAQRRRHFASKRKLNEILNDQLDSSFQNIMRNLK